MYFESHAHYDDKRFREDREKLLELLPSCGIDHVVNIGCDLKSWLLSAKSVWIIIMILVPENCSSSGSASSSALQNLLTNL